MPEIYTQIGIGGLFALGIIKMVLDFLNNRKDDPENPEGRISGEMRRSRDREIKDILDISEDLKRRVSRLNEQHDNPDNTGFGTVGFSTLIETNTQAMKELSHYIIWLGKQQGAGDPPPRLSGG